MRVILFGATGMVGKGVLRECCVDSEVEAVLSLVRPGSSGGEAAKHEKVRELVTDSFHDFSPLSRQLAGYDACFFCLGVSSFGMKEPDYRRITFDITLAAAKVLEGPAMTFCYVSGAGTNANGSQMWARVKGETENALLAMPFKAAYMFRPGMIVPMHGIRSKTPAYRIMYAVLTPVMPLLLRAFPKLVTTTQQLGRAMIAVSRDGYSKRILEAADIASF
jgi:uncharacterized protein YbjT (DUF2867 family)